MRQLLDLCRDRVRSLSASADPASHQPAPLASVIAGWRLLRPGVELVVQRMPASKLAVEPGVAHLLRALLDIEGIGQSAYRALRSLGWDDNLQVLDM